MCCDPTGFYANKKQQQDDKHDWAIKNGGDDDVQLLQPSMRRRQQQPQMMQGKLAEAGELLVEALAASRRVRGATHPETIQIARALARTYGEQGRDADAKELRALYPPPPPQQQQPGQGQGQGQQRHAPHQHTVQGKLAEAGELLVEALAASRRVRGATHPETIQIARALARTYGEQGRDADAEELRALYPPPPPQQQQPGQGQQMQQAQAQAQRPRFDPVTGQPLSMGGDGDA